MSINYEKEITFCIDESTIAKLVHYIFEEGIYINGFTYTANKVKMNCGIHFYFHSEGDTKKVYKFKDYQGSFVLNCVNKSLVQNKRRMCNIENIEKNEYYNNELLSFQGVFSVLHKERMTISFSEKDFRISFDKVVGVNPYTMAAASEPYYYLEIEFSDRTISFEALINKFQLHEIQQPKYIIGILDEKSANDLDNWISQQDITDYLDTINRNICCNFFDKYHTRYYFDGKNIELEVKIKNYTEQMKNKLLQDLREHFVVLYEDAYRLEDEYYDAHNILLLSNLSYRIRKTHNNQRRNLFLKVPMTNKGIYSSRIEYMTKFHNYSTDEIVSCSCSVNDQLNAYFNCNISQELKKVGNINTVRDVYLVLNIGDPEYLIGTLSFDETTYICDTTKEEITFNEIEFEIYNDCLTYHDVNKNLSNINQIMSKYSISNSNKYLNANQLLAIKAVNSTSRNN